MLFRASALLLLVTYVRAHGALVAVTGANGVTGQGFGIDPSTPRDGTGNKPFQQDTSIIRNRDVQSGKTGPCGRTQGAGNNDVPAQLAAAASSGLPSVSPDGSITMTVHQVNGDGAGPYDCDVSPSGTGNDFVKMQVTQQVPGIFGLSRAKATPFPLTAVMPAGVACTGGPNGDACVVRCKNPIGPFGGCVAVTNSDGGAAPGPAAGNTTVPTAPAPKAPTPQAPATQQKQGGLAGKLGAIFGNRRRGMRIMAALKRHADDSIDDELLSDLLQDPEVELDEEEI